ncbi:hypothetical protein [Glycomyces amatae]|uniref:hypothetical protein n=1 Tax=Glycomyces amatae TaxID=2881355 RepID=UPI00272CE8A5|nr:hypothetical protein [Glycomyces amatae]
MGLLSVPVDRVPAWTKIDLQLHQPYRTFLGFGRLRCDWCGERWGRHGCPSRESAARLFLHTASPAQRQAALDSGDLTPADLRLRRTAPSGLADPTASTDPSPTCHTSRTSHSSRPAHRRRPPSPHPRTASTPAPRGHRARDDSRPNPLTALRRELQAANR